VARAPAIRVHFGGRSFAGEAADEPKDQLRRVERTLLQLSFSAIFQWMKKERRPAARPMKEAANQGVV
jgi:hypothetical protein